MKKIYIFSPALRISHWIWALSITFLFISGIYIGNPFFLGPTGIEPTYADSAGLTMDWVRLIHFSFGYILFSVLLLRFLIIPFRKGDRLFPNFFSKAFYEGAFDTLKNYLFISSSHKPYVRNPLARTAYLIFYLLVLFEIITGFAMYGKINPTGFWYSLFGFVVPLLGGEFEVHFLHHIVAWFILFFVVLHVYFVIREDVLEKNGEVSSMINGTRDFESAPTDF